MQKMEAFLGAINYFRASMRDFFFAKHEARLNSDSFAKMESAPQKWKDRFSVWLLVWLRPLSYTSSFRVQRWSCGQTRQIIGAALVQISQILWAFKQGFSN
jgi:hypothetical protein